MNLVIYRQPPSDEVIGRCDDDSQLADLVTGAGAVRATVTPPRTVRITRTVARKDTVLATFDDVDVARFLSAAPLRLRTLAETVATCYQLHAPGEDGKCPRCGETAPCHERKLIAARMRG